MADKSIQRYMRKGISSIEIFEVLKTEIVSGKLPGNTQLKQADLAERFGISKIPVREALRRLEAVGLVAFRPRFGATVIALSASDVIDLLDTRLALECRALELSIPKLANSDLALAHDILEEYSEETEADRWSTLNVRFHDTLYQACDRPQLLNYIEDVKNRMGPFLRLNVTIAAGLDRPHKEHQQMLAACEQRDITLATAILREHIITTQKEVMSFMRHRKNTAEAL